MLMRTLRKRSIIIVIIGLLGFITYEWSCLVQKVNAIPAFARKYNFACNVCHVPGFPKLNDFGNTFRDHGFQLGSDNDLPDYEGITMGYWPVSLRAAVGYRTQTVGVNGTERGSGTTGPGDVTNGSFGFRTLNFLSYGLLARHVSYGIIYAPQLASANFNTVTGGSGGDLPLAFVRLNTLERLFGGSSSDSYLINMKVGKYEAELPFSAFRNPTQLNTPIVIYNYKAGSSYTSRAANYPANNRINTSAYTNNTLTSLQIGANGIEFAGIKPTDLTNGFFRYSLNGFSNTNLTGPSNTGGRGFYFYGHVTQSFGGYGIVSGHRVGISGWYGDAPTVANPLSTSAGTAGEGRKFHRVALDASTTLGGEWNLFGTILHAQDSKDLMTGTPGVNRQDAKWNGGFVELDWYPNELPFFGTPGWLFLYRYDVVKNEQQGDNRVVGNYGNVDSHVWSSRYYFHFSARTDIAWYTEFNWFRTAAVGNNGQDARAQMFFTGFDFSL